MRKQAFMVLIAALAGCYGTNDESAESIGEALELDNGGLDMGDELTSFGDARFEELGLESYVAIDDPMELEGTVVAMRERPDAIVHRVHVEWGQLPRDFAETDPRNWSGTFSVNRGALVVARAVRFEGRTDNLLPRTDPQVVPFTSVTLPHHDGLVLRVIDPNPGEGPIALTYTHHRSGESLSAPLAELRDGPVVLFSDDDGNRMIAAAAARPVDVCEHGVLAGKWHRIAEGRGVFLGRVANDEGELLGHVRGVYGQRATTGEKVFFGKYIRRDGTFRGIFAGGYDDGRFAGRWLNRSGEVGSLGGAYRESIPGPETGGHFIGRWAETSCTF